MSDNENKSKNTAMIRLIINIAIVIILFLGIFKIISKRITIPVSALLLFGIALWNGIESIKSGKKSNGIISFVTSAIILAMLVGYFITEFM